MRELMWHIGQETDVNLRIFHSTHATISAGPLSETKMPAFNQEEMQQAKLHAGRAAGLSTAAAELRAGLNEVISMVGARASFSFAISDSRTDIPMNFAISTVHTPIEAVFDHAIKDGELVGRYRFFAVQKMPSGNVAETEVWTLLFDANCNATSEPNGPFDWSFRKGDSATEASLGACLIRVLSKIQAALPRYETPFSG
jgi:hypothetical protein